MERSKRNSRKKNSDGSFTGTTDGNVDQIGPPTSENWIIVSVYDAKYVDGNTTTTVTQPRAR
eukprot:scaffold12162_cov53-Attheya_sp.AAC.1